MPCPFRYRLTPFVQQSHIKADEEGEGIGLSEERRREEDDGERRRRQRR